MISWIQKYFQHHFKTIFAILLAVTIISFIFTIGASPGIGRGDRRYVDREFFGYNLAMAGDQQRLMGDATLSINLQVGAMMGLDNDQVQQYAFQRAASLHLADTWHIPASTEAEIKEAIKKLRMFAGQDGQFDPKAYATFRDNLKNSKGGVNAADIARVIGDDVRMEKVNALLAGPGYVLARDVRAQLERADTTWTLAIATADYASFAPDFKPTDVQLTKFFEDNVFRYEIPPRVVATYIEFPAANYVANVKITDAEVRAFYDANPARFPKPAAAKPADPKAPANADADFAAARPQVQATLIRERAQSLAQKAASDVAVAIFESKIPNGPALEGVLAGRKLQPKPLAPFTREAGPAELGNSPEIADAAFRLNKDRYISDALPTPNGAAVLFWKDIEPARKPPFVEVRAKVLADFTENEKRKRFVELGKVAKSQIEARLKAGDAFDKAVAAAGSSSGLKFETKSIAPFSLRSRPQDLDYTLLTALEQLSKGQVSDMVLSPDKGVLVYAQDKKLPDLSEANPKFAETKAQLATFSARMGATAYVAEIVERELKRTEPKVQ
ncbi:peptidyl-prolyl cis-trans isomerase [Opitutus sp. ER46]|uniref:peptidyl-prolyl cis-trans isomerase n=1 Tax=Opitutus sp. ER46 TaxID=2161864 RepID=UPI001304EDBE|nr:peptidyl-prolyl cis-trans isomerase [Opitutus sp. ER46]